MNEPGRVYVAGHRGLVGSALVRLLDRTAAGPVLKRTHAELDLRRQGAVDEFFAAERPRSVYLAAARVGGIHANASYPADFIRDNLQVEANVIDAAYRHGVEKLCFLGSSCIYPRLAPQPMREEYLLTGPLEPTNEWYAIAKIAGIKMCQAYRRQYGFRAIAAMPTNLYGPGDNFSLEDSHVLPALIRKFDDARERGAGEVLIWGTGAPRREFLYVDDLAEALLFLMERYDEPDIINVGTGTDVSISELAQLVREVVGYTGRLAYDRSKPDGAPRKLLDVSRMRALGWSARTALADGIERTWRWYRDNREHLRR
jgi:GDP-L-fucose synthase